MSTNKYGDSGISPRVNVYAARQMLKHAAPVNVLQLFGLAKPFPKNNSQTMKFRQPNVFDASTTPLVEGVTPSSTRFSYTDKTAVLKQYGQVVEVTDHIEDTHEDPVLNDATVQCGENIGRTIEALTYGVVKAGTNVFYANGAARNAVNTPVTKDKLRKVVRALKAQKAMKHTRMLDGSTNYNTKPIEAAFIAVCHTDLEADIRGLSGFTPVAEYGSRKPCCEHELGSIEDIRFVCSPDLEAFADAGGAYAGSGTDMITTTGTSADVYPILVFGKEAYGTVALRGAGSVKPSIIPAGQISNSDPLGQVGKVGWKTYYTAVILNELWMARLEVAATAL